MFYIFSKLTNKSDEEVVVIKLDAWLFNACIDLGNIIRQISRYMNVLFSSHDKVNDKVYNNFDRKL